MSKPRRTTAKEWRATAQAKANSQLHVYAVSNLDQVLRILKRLGGNVPTNPVLAQVAP